MTPVKTGQNLERLFHQN